MAKKTLEFEFEVNFRLIGIATSMQDYKFCHYVNSVLNLELKRIEDRVIHDFKANSYYYFNQYYAKNELDKLEFYLIKNKAHSKRLLEELNIMDFLLLIAGEPFDDYITSILRKVRSLSNVNAVKEIEAKTIKQIENLIIDEDTF